MKDIIFAIIVITIASLSMVWMVLRVIAAYKINPECLGNMIHMSIYFTVAYLLLAIVMVGYMIETIKNYKNNKHK